MLNFQKYQPILLLYFSTIKFVFDQVFNYYSKNFDNYIILINILNVTNEPIRKIELSSDFNSKNDGEKNEQLKNVDNTIQLIDKISSENKINIKESEIN